VQDVQVLQSNRGFSQSDRFILIQVIPIGSDTLSSGQILPQAPQSMQIVGSMT
jgi:hypothetical protein